MAEGYLLTSTKRGEQPLQVIQGCLISILCVVVVLADVANISQRFRIHSGAANCASVVGTSGELHEDLSNRNHYYSSNRKKGQTEHSETRQHSIELTAGIF